MQSGAIMPYEIENVFRTFARRQIINGSLLLSAAIAFLVFLAVAALILGYLTAAIVILIAGAALAIYPVFRSILETRAGNEGLKWQPADPAIQRQQLGISVDYLSKSLDIDAESLADLQSAFIVAEDLALRQIQTQEKCAVIRQSEVFGIAFDAIYLKDRTLVCIEVIFLVTPAVSDERISAVLKKSKAVAIAARKSVAELNVRLMLLIITQLQPEDLQKLRANLTASRFSGTPVDIDIRFMDFEALQRIYVCD